MNVQAYEARPGWRAAWLLIIVLPLGCHRQPPKAEALPTPMHAGNSTPSGPLMPPANLTTPAAEPASQPPPRFDVKAVSSQEGEATWYEVPAGSLAERRAWNTEMTAAHDRLPLGTYVRVTNLTGGKQVIARITDHGIHRRGTVIDLSRPAAEALDFVRAGHARVRVEALRLSVSTSKPAEDASGEAKLRPAGGGPPADAPRAATHRQEQNAAAAPRDNRTSPASTAGPAR